MEKEKMGEISEKLYCIDCDEFFPDDIDSYDEEKNLYLCPKCNRSLVDECFLETILQKFKEK